ncbi:cytochrome P450 [Streptosporangium sp. NPDC051023]|uniref:cytochrome P450 n=1 Tax=Streptosporangium sp. NPDC051023 TaxID=3155410 RepID=UPI00344EC475
MAKAVETAATRKLPDLPVAPGRLPLLGHSMSLLRSPFAFLQSLTVIGDIVRVDIGTLPVYMLTRPELVHQILVTKARDIQRGILFERVRPLHGNGLTVAEGQAHLRQRRLLQPVLHPNAIGGYVETMRRNTQALADSWREGQRIDVSQVTTDLILAITTDAMFGMSVEPAAVRTVRAAVPAILGNLMVRTQMPVFLERFPLPVNRRFEAAARDVRRVVDEVVAHRREHPSEEGDLIGMLLSARDPESGEPMSARQVRDEAVGVFINGIATTATTLAWFLHQLARNPDSEERLLAEVEAVRGDGTPLDQALGRLGYTRRVIQEVLRLHPLLMLMRRTTRSLTLGGVEIPPGVELGYSPTALHRDPAVYPEPYRLDPDRWLPERAKPLPAGAFAAFGEGRHRCIGEHFAWAELLVAAAVLLPRWKLRHADDHGAEDVREVNAIHPRPDRLHMVLTARTAPDRGRAAPEA